MAEHSKFVIDEIIATITLDWPERLNVCIDEMLTAWISVLKESHDRARAATRARSGWKAVLGRHRCEVRQVADANIAIVHNEGGIGPSYRTMIFGRAPR
jgi:hypothetical protein